MIDGLSKAFRSGHDDCGPATTAPTPRPTLPAATKHLRCITPPNDRRALRPQLVARKDVAGDPRRKA